MRIGLKYPSPLELKHFLCSNQKHQGRQTQKRLIIHGLDQDPFKTTKLAEMYEDCGDAKSAYLLFDKLSQLNVFTRTSILSAFAGWMSD
ncbi:hypothetical protein Vadar_031823 [Vaccinium darrowii]|uniref:Uncharacterized protein n=1 Tax=Vaccinium darrowii TaxID=229202 RepID=A0ACB7YHJ4_9ERIC|nr:hypothetical protein Vadar_031823 [Vaccinium darrowii]